MSSNRILGTLNQSKTSTTEATPLVFEPIEDDFAKSNEAVCCGKTSEQLHDIGCACGMCVLKVVAGTVINAACGAAIGYPLGWLLGNIMLCDTPTPGECAPQYSCGDLMNPYLAGETCRNATFLTIWSTATACGGWIGAGAVVGDAVDECKKDSQSDIENQGTLRQRH